MKSPPRPYSLSRRSLVLTPLANGTYWTWSCGWWMIDPDTRRVLSHRALGHVEFRRLPQATRAAINARNVTFTTRPTGDWRRAVTNDNGECPTPYEHSVGLASGTFQLVRILATDGVHAIVMPYDAPDTDQPGWPKTVHFTNLTEVKMELALPRTRVKAAASTSTSPRKQKKLTYSLDELL